MDYEQSEKEREHQEAVIAAFANYRPYELSANHRRRKDFIKLPSWQQTLLPDYLDFLEDIDKHIIKNSIFLRQAAAQARTFLLLEEGTSADPRPTRASVAVSEGDQHRLRSTIRQFVREWSLEGEAERSQSYRPLLDALEATLVGRAPEKCAVLAPGCGLGRLVYEVVKRGYQCQGNECSMFMLIASQFILNETVSVNQHEIFPFLHSLTNIVRPKDALQGIRIPDVLPGELQPGLMSMVAGDFVEVYSRPDHKAAFDVVLTCFFIDTASNVIEYLTTIRHCLKKGGTWINCGPLLWHFENSQDEASLDLTLEDVKDVAGRLGFAIENERLIPARYTSSPFSMMATEYQAAFWTAKLH